jgi:hypothetical protein
MRCLCRSVDCCFTLCCSSTWLERIAALEMKPIHVCDTNHYTESAQHEYYSVGFFGDWFWRCLKRIGPLVWISLTGGPNQFLVNYTAL